MFPFQNALFFTKENYIIQYYNDDFEEFVDLDDISDCTLLIEKRLKIVFESDMSSTDVNLNSTEKDTSNTTHSPETSNDEESLLLKNKESPCESVR